VQLPLPAGVAALALQRLGAAGADQASPQASQPLAEQTVLQPVQLEAVVGQAGERCWLLSNGLVRAELGAEGVLQLWDAAGLPQLAAPLQWCRWADHGEFWDAWDIAADYRDHPLPLEWQGEPELAEQGPLCSRLVWRGRCGSSDLRLDVQLRAATPWLELGLRVHWQQRHELLRLEIPLAQRACRVAADTAGGVLERPAEALTAREQARWEVAAVSWLASQAAQPARGGLAVLLDGPQGVSAAADRLGVSLLRAPTWPDPGADNGLQRLRLALMPCAEGWRQQGVPRQALRFREPLWRRPGAWAEGEATAALARAGLSLPLSFGSDQLQLVGLQPGEAPGTARLVMQNLSPLRQRLQWPSGWHCRRELDPELAAAAGSGDQLLQHQQLESDQLGPWQLGRWIVTAC
jgi:alpha-mannosidase